MFFKAIQLWCANHTTAGDPSQLGKGLRVSTDGIGLCTTSYGPSDKSFNAGPPVIIPSRFLSSDIKTARLLAFWLVVEPFP